jgi:hypothetical protein
MARQISQLEKDSECQKDYSDLLIVNLKRIINLDYDTNNVDVEVGFPNESWFSDHLPVGAILELQ